PGRMNLMATAGLPGGEAACENSFPGSHVCTYAELVATPASSMTGLKDTSNTTVTSFWAVDPARPENGQCGATANPGAVRWTYATAHLGVGGDFVTLTNATGVLGSLSLGGGAVRNCATGKWIGCCH